MNELLFEIGCEEIPARVVPDVLAHMHAKAMKLGEEHGLDITGDVQTYGTPRRLTLSVTGLPEQTKRVKKKLSGPPVRAAFDAEGKPTKAAEGFAKTAGTTVDKLQREQTPKGEYLVAEVEEGGEAAIVVLERFLSTLLSQMPLPKSMRWGAEEVKFSRPVQWLLAVFTTDAKSQVIPLQFGLLNSGLTTRGHRFMANEPFEARRRKDYLEQLRERHVIADPAARKERVLEEARKAAQQAGGVLYRDPQGKFDKDPLAQATYFDGLLEEITYLCESPYGVFGTFDTAALELPREVVLTAMRNHQRYFGVAGDDGALKAAFVTIAASRVKDPALVRRGNERVLKARLSDARYFFVEDQKRELASRVDDLKTVTYHKKIGSSHEKLQRVLKLAMEVGRALRWEGQPVSALGDAAKPSSGASRYATLARAVLLAKADLTTLMVGEFPELQGIVGSHYATLAGESADVVKAVRDHYRPRSADDAVADDAFSAVIAIADKLDTIVGIIAVGQQPSGSSDPFGLRRASIGILRTLVHHGWELDLNALAQHALQLHPPALAKADVLPKVHAFLADRFLNYFLPQTPGSEADAVRAVVSTGVAVPVDAAYRLHALQRFTKDAEFATLAATLKRALNILKTKPQGEPNPALFAHDAEHALHAQTQEARKQKKGGSIDAYSATLHAVAKLRPAVDGFFQAVMVMDKDEAVKQNRLRLLTQVAELVSDIADFEKLA